MNLARNMQVRRPLELEARPSIPAELFRRKMAARQYQKVLQAVQQLDQALQADHYGVAQAVWFELAAQIMRKVSNSEIAEECEKLSREAVSKAQEFGRMRKRRKLKTA
jgi:hypothetical protein